MNIPHHRSAELVSKQDRRELSLEEMDVLTRKCHHLHDEEIARLISRIFTKASNLFEKSHHHPNQQPAK